MNKQKDFAFEKWDVNNNGEIDMNEFDNFMMPIMEMRRNQKTDQVFEPHDKEKAFIFDGSPVVEYRLTYGLTFELLVS